MEIIVKGMNHSCSPAPIEACHKGYRFRSCMDKLRCVGTNSACRPCRRVD